MYTSAGYRKLILPGYEENKSTAPEYGRRRKRKKRIKKMLK